jgi:hypothetical protein
MSGVNIGEQGLIKCEELDESKENIGFHVLYRLILSLNLFARYTFCIELACQLQALGA